MNKHLSFVIISITLSSCAINYKMPDSRFITPESSGGFKTFSLETGYGRGKNVVITDDFSTGLARKSDVRLEDAAFLYGRAAMGITEGLDVGLQYLTDEGLALTGKYQLIGKRGQTGFQMAVAGHAGGGSENKSETDNTPTRGELDTSFIGGDFIIGYRFTPAFQMYTSVFYDDADYDFKQTRGTSSVSFKGGSTNRGATLGAGLNFGNGGKIGVEFSRARGQTSKERLTTSSFGAFLAVGIY